MNKYSFRNILQKRWLQHLVFWVAWVLLMASIHSLRSQSMDQFMGFIGFDFIQMIFLMGSVYLNLLIYIPQLLSKKKYVRYVLSVILTTALISIINNYTLNLVGIDIHSLRPGFKGGPPREMHFIIFIFFQFFWIAITSLIHFVKESAILNETALRVKELESSKLAVELESLKAQINPHFLFNTLNNIYSHALLESKKTPEMIIRLSDLMNYVIYECKDDRVSVSKELDFIKSYIELERERVDEAVKINFSSHAVPGYHVAPLIFVSLLENAFKHGVNINQDNPYISIDFNVTEDGHLSFKIENLKDTDENIKSGRGGIGIENVKKRLELIYPDKHTLSIQKTKTTFTVVLTIDLEIIK